jgi:hypothetical protein
MFVVAGGEEDGDGEKWERWNISGKCVRDCKHVLFE